MSYADDIRGALAATSGASRRIQALRELGLPEAEEKGILLNLDEATESLMNVVEILARNGVTARAMGVITAGNSKADRQMRLMEQATRPWTPVKGRVAPKGKRTYEEVFPEDTSPPAPAKPQVDAAHPWRSE